MVSVSVKDNLGEGKNFPNAFSDFIINPIRIILA